MYPCATSQKEGQSQKILVKIESGADGTVLVHRQVSTWESDSLLGAKAVLSQLSA